MASPPNPNVTITPYATFSVSSGSLCFGSFNDIWDGAAAPIQEFPEVRPRVGGTIAFHSIDYNIIAHNGTWNIYQLVDLDNEAVTAWFAAREDVEAWAEVDRILRISGSPYEDDSGDTMNTERTAAAGVFVINRYDWCMPRKNHVLDTLIDDKPKDVKDSKDVKDPKDTDDSDDDYDSDDTSASQKVTYGTGASLVDKDHAKETVLEWINVRSSPRFTDHSADFFVPGGEYNFGRFAFDEERRAARSFIYFTMNTVFTNTTFKGLTQPLRIEETAEELFNRLIREGRDFSGLGWVKESTTQHLPDVRPFHPPPPPAAELLGPFDAEEYILTSQDFEALRAYSRTRYITDPHTWTANGHDLTRLVLIEGELLFEPTWKANSHELLNELALGFVEKHILPVATGYSLSSAAEVLFPRHSDAQPDRDRIDDVAYPHFINPLFKPVPEFDISEVVERMRRFLQPKVEQGSEISDDILLGASRVLAYMLTELLELARNCARDSRHPGILPNDIRISFMNDYALRAVLQNSRVFWEGGREPQERLQINE